MDWAGSWSKDFSVLSPVSADLISPVLAVAPRGQVAVTSGQTQGNAPGAASAALVTGTAADVFAPEHVLDGAQTLAVGYLGPRLVLLNGTSVGGVACCSGAAVQAGPGAARLGAPQPVVDGLAGTSYGALVPVRGGLMAAVDNQSGITAARSDPAANFGPGEQLVGNDPTPPLMAAAPLHDGGALIAWTAPATGPQSVTGTTTASAASATPQGYDQPQNQLIRFATAGPSGLPGAPRLAVTVPAGREIDALSAVSHGAGVTLAWTESWYIGLRTYRSEVFWADLTSGSVQRVRQLSPASSAAVGLSLAGMSGGREVLTWQACDVSGGACQVDAALRPHGDVWGPVTSLGDVDPAAFPVATQSRLGQSLVAWIDDGVVLARAARPDGTVFYPVERVSAHSGASSLFLSFGAGRRAVAVWVQGTLDQKLVGARFTP